MQRGELWWAALRSPRGSEPAYRRPVVIVQADDFNRSRIQTVIAAAVTSNPRLGMAPGNVVLSRKQTGLARNAVVNVSQLLTINKTFLTTKIGRLPPECMRQLDEGLRLVLSL